MSVSSEVTAACASSSVWTVLSSSNTSTLESNLARYDIKCTECGESIEIDVPLTEVKEKYRRKCPTCGKTKTFTRDWSAGIAAYHDRYSPMHPRKGRGRGGPGMART